MDPTTRKLRAGAAPDPPDTLPQARRSLTGLADYAEDTLHKASRRVLAGMATAVIVALALSAAAFAVSVSTTRAENAVAAAERVAARAQAGHDQLALANTARALRGLPPFPDPGPSASPDLVWLVAARAWYGVDAAEAQAGGVPGSPGVTTPAPTGPFPSGPTR